MTPVRTAAAPPRADDFAVPIPGAVEHVVRPRARPGGHGPLRGHRSERERLDEVLHALRAGHGQALVVRGAPGIGKTALLDDLAERAAGCRVIRVAADRMETQVAYAGLHQLCLPALDRLAELPPTHAEALGAALGLRGASSPSPLLVGLGLLALLGALARERPVLCLVDNAQWLDPASAQVLGLAARRLGSEFVGTVIAIREPAADEHLASLPDVRVGRLADEDAGAVLDAAVAHPLDVRVRTRILSEARGNPRALHDALREVRPDETAGGLGLSLAPPIADREGEHAVRTVRALPPESQRFLLIAALEPFGDPAVVARAAGAAGVDPAAAAPATDAGLLAIDGVVRFREPHLRRVIHEAATPQERQDAHRALADASDAFMDAERAVWHRGHATLWPEEAVAETLERMAARTRTQGATATAGALMQRAVELTPGALDRARRALVAAEIMHDAGAEEASARLLTVAEAGPLDAAGRVRSRAIRGRITHTATYGGDSAALLLDAADELRQVDGSAAADGYREAFLAALSGGPLADARSITDVAAAIDRTAAGDELLQAAGAAVLRGYAAAAPSLRRALEAASAATATPAESRLGCVVARALADDTEWDRWTTGLLRRARETGTTSTMPIALAERLTFELLSGRLAVAMDLADELSVTIATARSRSSLNRALWLTTWRGDADEALALMDALRPDAIRRGHGQWLLSADYLGSTALNGVGRYEEALGYAARAAGHPYDLGMAVWTLPELVEAAARSGAPERGQVAGRRLAELAAASGTDWALGLAARCQALLDDGDDAERGFTESIARLSRTRITSALARTHLVYGEWLRRHQRRVDARTHLRVAHDMLAGMGADGFAERARRELIATGETVRRRSPDALDDLTPQETEIARLAATGQTNREIGAQLYLSPRTVEWHLHKVFAKLGVSSRKVLSGALVGSWASPA